MTGWRCLDVSDAGCCAGLEAELSEADPGPKECKGIGGEGGYASPHPVKEPPGALSRNCAYDTILNPDSPFARGLLSQSRSNLKNLLSSHTGAVKPGAVRAHFRGYAPIVPGDRASDPEILQDDFLSATPVLFPSDGDPSFAGRVAAVEERSAPIDYEEIDDEDGGYDAIEAESGVYEPFFCEHRVYAVPTLSTIPPGFCIRELVRMERKKEVDRYLSRLSGRGFDRAPVPSPALLNQTALERRCLSRSVIAE